MSIKILSAQQPLVRSAGKGISQLIENAEYVFLFKGIIYKIVVPFGFYFDGASIPRLLWSILGLSPHGDMDGPSLPHDFVFHYAGRLPENSFFIVFEGTDIACNERFTKPVSDALLRALCLYFGVTGKAKAFLVYFGVYLFGWWSWWRDDKDRKERLCSGL